MSVAGAIIEQLDRFLAARIDRETVRRAENGEWDAALWDEIEAMGLTLLMVPEEQGGIGLNWRQAQPALVLLGRHGVPVPLGETIVAGWLLAKAGLDRPEGPLTLAVARPGSGRAEGIAHGRRSGHLVVGDDGRTVRYALSGASIVPGDSIAREPRDSIELSVLREGGRAASTVPVLWAGAALRAAQMAGALAAIRDMAIEYANIRVQFGKPIGKFQAVQQALAQLAGEAAAAGMAAAMAARALDQEGGALHIAAAKIRAGEAAGAGATIAHQSHGAIGFTDDHRLHDLTRRLWTWRDDFGGERYWAGEIGRLAVEAGGDVWGLLTGTGRG
jgi:acyl-CoA dehydrogenase